MNGRSPVAALISDSSRGNKAAILNAALAAFGETGFNGASMRDIARGAGTSLSNLYNYFPSKSHLLAELLQRANDELLNRTSTAVRNAGSSPTERMREAVKAYVGFVVDHQTAALVAISEIRYLHGEHRERSAPGTARRPYSARSSPTASPGRIRHAHPDGAARNIVSIFGDLHLVQQTGTSPKALAGQHARYAGLLEAPRRLALPDRPRERSALLAPPDRHRAGPMLTGTDESSPLPTPTREITF